MSTLYGLPDADAHAALATGLSRTAGTDIAIEAITNIADPADGVVWQLAWSGAPTIDAVLDQYERLEYAIVGRPRHGSVTSFARVEDRRGRRLRLVRAAA